MIAFYDPCQVTVEHIMMVIDHENLKILPWPDPGVVFRGGNDKWSNAQRYKMLAGFVHVPAEHVDTEYWLKLDTDTVATGNDDWIDPAWFDSGPAIVSHPWGFTKPPYQMVKLDAWAEENGILFTPEGSPPLGLVPDPESDRLRHKRIISWCGFFSTLMTSTASLAAERTCGKGQLPVPSQDGYLFYISKRLGLEIKRVQMKNRGWQHWSSMYNVQRASREALKC